MRPRSIFLILVAPLIPWGIVHWWIRLNINSWAEGETPLSLATRVLLVIDNNIVRYLPFVAFGIITLAPLFALVLIRIPGAVPRPVKVTECINVTSVALRGWLGLAILFGVGAVASLVVETGSAIALTTLLTWMFFVAYLFSLACAYAIQEHLALRGRSRFGGGWVIGLAFVLNLFSLVLLSLLLPAAVYFRCRYERRSLAAVP